MSTQAGPSPIQRLFNKFDAYYPAKFRAAFTCAEQTSNWLEAWAEALADQEISFQQVKLALELCISKKLEWPPSLPEFIDLCKPKINHEVSWYNACVELCNRENGSAENWKHPAVFWAAMDVSAFDLRRLSYSQIKSRWIAALDAQFQKKTWDAIPVSAKRLEKLERVKTAELDLIAKEHVKKMRQMLSETRFKSNRPQGDTSANQ